MARPKKTDETTLAKAAGLAVLGYSPAQIAAELGMKAENPAVTARHLNALAREIQPGRGIRPEWYEYAVAEHLKAQTALVIEKRKREKKRAEKGD